MNIPFTKTTLGKEEKKAISDVIDSGWVVMGKKTQEFEETFADYVGSKYAVFVDSGTAALFLSLNYWKQQLKIDRIAIPSLTFTSTAEVVVNSDLQPVFVDVNKSDFCIDSFPENASLTIPVHLTGNKCTLPALIYDSAHRIEKNDLKGRVGLWCYSFYATKNLTTINGGMIALNDKVIYEWLKKARDHGITQGTIERYKDGKWAYNIEFVGWRMKADDVRAVIGLEQLKKLPENTERRNALVAQYNALLGLNRGGNHLYPILVNERLKFIEFMKEQGIQCSVHFLPLHRMTAYKDYPHEDLTNTEYLGDRLVSLPLYPQMTKEEVEYTVDKVLQSNLFINE